MVEHPTLLLKKDDVSLLQDLADAATGCACLVVYNGDDTGRRHALDQPQMVLGRTPQAEIYLDSTGVSRRHAALESADGDVRLRDLGSVNGTFLNEQRVDAPVVLNDGDLIRLGSVVLKFFRRASLDALLHDRIYRLATIDPDTGVYCKRHLLQALQHEVRRSRCHGDALSVVCLDLDHFKSVNDRFGHIAGDDVLRGTAAAVQAVTRQADLFGRIGGEEFAVVLPRTPLPTALALAERFRAAVEAAVFDLTSGDGAAERHRQTVSLGVAQLGPEIDDARILLGAADAMLYAAKRNGRNRVHG